jgi:hypothetical protein
VVEPFEYGGAIGDQRSFGKEDSRPIWEQAVNMALIVATPKRTGQGHPEDIQ